MSDNQSSLQRFKSLGIFKSSKKLQTPDQNEFVSPLLRLPKKLRMLIYEYAFTRTPMEHFKALHHGTQASSASGLMLVCRQIRTEASKIYEQETIINLWPHFFRDGRHVDKRFSAPPPVIASWRKSRHGRTLKHHPERVHKLGLLINLTREENSMSYDYVDSDILKSSHLQPTDLYLRVCICRSLQWLHDTPFSIMSFCIALETFAMHLPSLERIHILYCGQCWPKWLEASEDDVPFPDAVLARHTVRMHSGANWSVQRVGEKKRSWGPTTGRDPSQVQPQARQSVVETVDEEQGDRFKLRTLLTWNHSQAHPGDSMTKVQWKERSVEISYYDSRTLLNVQCVRDKPPRPQNDETTVPVTRLMRERSTFVKGAIRVKDFVESWHLGPEWLDHRPKEGGPGESGSHSRYHTRQ